ncbi:class I SAM-dependent methyltransferase [Trinickia violacea]|uniref:Class I SAM-dependent methyltransferase n=1 Tax=Trinickia violacea TaxID=2571746 RepID=A0A4P8J0C4_9BURK|nr:class I SAM-dependent methyltransferase [Trinickia violacea]QCP55102.1 class I SAM-dependent methyltransferase [Trinickia violacea]
MNHLSAYLEAIGIVDGVTSQSIACEVCGHTGYEIVVDSVATTEGRFDRLPVVACELCGFLYQNPRFNAAFYQAYYERYYRQALFGQTQPERDFVLDQMRRGEFLYRSLAAYLPPTGHLLDVGCSAGGMMVPFARRGWIVAGNDPDAAYAEFGSKQLQLRIDVVAAENMRLPDAQFDLIVIIGSLEHAYDINRVLALCRKACAPDGLLLIEGRAFGYGVLNGHFSHNHRRYLTIESIEMLMLRHGWEPVLSTDAPLCGPTRPGGVHVLGKASTSMSVNALVDLIPVRWPEHGARTRHALTNLTGFVGAAVSSAHVTGAPS